MIENTTVVALLEDFVCKPYLFSEVWRCHLANKPRESRKESTYIYWQMAAQPDFAFTRERKSGGGRGRSREPEWMEGASSAVQFREGAFRLHAPPFRRYRVRVERQGQSSQSLPRANEGGWILDRRACEQDDDHRFSLPSSWPSKVEASARLSLV